MRVKIPLTGTRLPDGGGDPNDPVSVITLELGDVSWRAVSWDWDNGLVEVELIERPRHSKEVDAGGNPIFTEPLIAYQARRDAALDHVRSLLVDKTPDELYALSGSPRLKNLFKENKS